MSDQKLLRTNLPWIPLNVSQLAHERVEKAGDVVSVGDEIIVKALGMDKRGRQNFSRKDALPKPKEKKVVKEEKVEEEIKEDNTPTEE